MRANEAVPWRAWHSWCQLPGRCVAIAYFSVPLQGLGGNSGCLLGSPVQAWAQGGSFGSSSGAHVNQAPDGRGHVQAGPPGLVLPGL